MRDNPRRGFDQLIVKTFINSTGVYPVGTLVILDTLELAVVSKNNPDVAHLHQLLVRIISDEMAVPLTTPLQVDLALDGRAIIKTTNPQKYGIRVSDYLM
jgi:hypothetical protein